MKPGSGRGGQDQTHSSPLACCLPSFALLPLELAGEHLWTFCCYCRHVSPLVNPFSVSQGTLLFSPAILHGNSQPALCSVLSTQMLSLSQLLLHCTLNIAIPSLPGASGCAVFGSCLLPAVLYVVWCWGKGILKPLRVCPGGHTSPLSVGTYRAGSHAKENSEEVLFQFL